MNKNKKIIIAISLVLIGVLGRALPHLWNFTPIIAIGIFANFYLGKKWGVALPLLSMLLSDIFLGFYNPVLMISVYGSFALVGITAYLIKRSKNTKNIILASFVASTLFFIITNFASWWITPFYEKSLLGLLEAYTLGLPFYRNMLLGDMFYTMSFFGVYELVTNKQLISFLKKKFV